MELYRKTIAECAGLLRSGELRSVELTRSLLDRIAAVDPKLGAYLTITADLALEQAAAADRRLGNDSREELPLLLGIPLGLKDNLCTKGVRTTCGSRLLRDYVPPYEGTAISRLLGQGAVTLGKTNLDEFAMGSSNENSAFFPACNPWDLDRVPGGSSGGSCVAVAADACMGAFGSDTGGSIRQPASFCGVVGMKPTYGRVSRYGLVAFASSLDQIGPLAKTVEDAAILLQAVSGHDPCDSTSSREPVPDFRAAIGRDVRGLRAGVPREYFLDGMDPDVETSVRAAIHQLESMGVTIEEVSLPHTEYAVATYYVLATSEASSNLARFDGVRYGAREAGDNLIEMYRHTRSAGFGAEVKRRIMLGTFALSSGYYDAYYLKAQKVRTVIRRDFERAFEQVDLLLCPTAPGPAFGRGEKLEDPLQMYLTDIFTISANLTGGPGLSVPCGFTEAGLPVGLQILGRPFDEATLLRVGHAYEQATDWHKKKPVLNVE